MPLFWNRLKNGLLSFVAHIVNVNRSMWCFVLGAISATFYAHVFCMKDNCAVFLSYILALLFFGIRISVKKARIKCWWNWPLYSGRETTLNCDHYSHSNSYLTKLEITMFEMCSSKRQVLTYILRSSRQFHQHYTRAFSHER
jgi:hypothetical protein